jgi:hypothetical protein
MTATRISTIRKVALALGLVLSLLTVGASLSLAYSSKARQMCMGDAFRLCSSAIPDIGRIVACMRRNKANLSPGCRAVMDQEDGTAAKAKPAQTAPVAQKPPVATFAEQSAAAETKPAQTAPVVPKPTVAAPVESPAATEAKPPQTAPVAQAPTVATPVEPPAATETNRSLTGPVVQGPTVATPVEQPAAIEAKPAQTAPVVQRPSVAAPVEQPAAIEAKPAQTAPVAQRPSVVAPVDVKPVGANSTPRGKPAKLARHNKRYGQQIVAWDFQRNFWNMGRSFGFALPMPLIIGIYW